MAVASKIDVSHTIHVQLKKIRTKLLINDLVHGFVFLSLFSLLLFGFFLVVDIAFELNIAIRYFALTLFLLVFACLFINGLIRPVFQYFGLIRGYDDLSIAKRIIINSPVEDKLLTLIELEKSESPSDFLLCAIQQRTYELSVVSFHNDISLNYRFLRYFLFSLLLIILASVCLYKIPVLTIASKRILTPGYKASYKQLDISVTNNDLTVKQGESLTIHIIAIGTYTPGQLFVDYDNSNHPVTKLSDSSWSFTFSNVNQDVRFCVHDQLNQSPFYLIKCHQLPVLANIEISVTPPSYTGYEPFVVHGSGSFTCPEGSNAEWTFESKNAVSLLLSSDNFSDSLVSNNDVFFLTRRVFNDFLYELTLFSPFVSSNEKQLFNVKVLKDKFPTISVTSQRPVVFYQPLLVSLSIEDDYGFSSLDLVISTVDSSYIFPIPFEKNNISQRIAYNLDINSLCNDFEISRCQFYFLVRDNDVVNGFKESRSEIFDFEIPDSTEIENQKNFNTQNIIEKLSLGASMMKQLSEQINEYEKRLRTEQMSEWDISQIQNEISAAKDQMKQLLDEVNKLNDELKQLTEITADEKEDELREKQLEIQKMLEQLMDDELRELLNELDKLSKENNKNLDNSRLSLEMLDKILDRNLESLKRFEIEKGINDLAQELENLAKELQEAESSSERDSIENLIDKILDKHDALLEKNQNLKRPFDLEQFVNEKQSLRSQMSANDSQGNEQKQNVQNAKSTRSMAQRMKENMAALTAEMQTEDLANLKQLRENLLFMSFRQELLIDSLSGADRRMPSFNRLKIKQMNLIEIFDMVSDSLNDLMSRNPDVAMLLGEDLLEVGVQNRNLLESIKNPTKVSFTVNQQFILTHYNNLLVFIDEVIRNSEQEPMGDGSSGSCDQKGKKKPSPGEIGNMQKGLKQQLQQMMQMMQKGEGLQMSEQMGRFLSQQEQIQKQLGELMNSGEVGSGAREMLKEVNRMIDQNIAEVLNRAVTRTTIARQEKIMTKLLESERAEQERKQEERRESRENRREYFSQDFEHSTDSLKRDFLDEGKRRGFLNLTKYYLDLYQKYIMAVE